VLRFGGVKPATLAKPAKVFTQPKPAFAKADGPDAQKPAEAKDAPAKP
jgi:hypothetical protein